MEFEKPVKARVVKDYEASDPEPLVVVVGERLQVGRRDTTWPAFVRCRNGAGNEGWVPVTYLEIKDEVGVARVDYSAVELTVSSGEVLTLKKEEGGWYWAKKASGEKGWIPVESVEITAT